MLTLITPTGERPEAFSLCQKMMKRQTYRGKVRWIIVDDGEKPQDITFKKPNWTIEVIRPRPYWRVGDNTQGRNLKAALERVDAARDVIAVIEDDDFYGPGWLRFIATNIRHAELIGEREAVYYNVRRRVWDAIHNTSHACLRNSAMRGAAIEWFREVLQTPDRYYDLKLWRGHGDKTTFPRVHTLGIKSMPGRQGIAQGHDGLKGSPDPDLNKLRELIGEDADWYADFYEFANIYEDRLFCLRPMPQGDGYAVGDYFDAKLTPLQREVLVAGGYLTRQRVRAAGR